VLTSTTYKGRLLGTNTLGVYPNKTTWAVSVNNGSFNTDIKRRTVLIRLDSGMANPDERDPKEFKHKHLLKWALEHRTELLRACLILCQRWIAVGRPAILMKFDYVEWSGALAGLMQSIGMSGFLGNRDQIVSTDNAKWVALVRVWARARQDNLARPMTSTDLYDLVAKNDKLQIEFADLFTSITEGARKRRLIGQMEKIRGRTFKVPTRLADKIVAREYRVWVQGSDGSHRRYWLELTKTEELPLTSAAPVFGDDEE
jgi:hypothetical protein